MVRKVAKYGNPKLWESMQVVSRMSAAKGKKYWFSDLKLASMAF